MTLKANSARLGDEMCFSRNYVKHCFELKRALLVPNLLTLFSLALLEEIVSSSKWLKLWQSEVTYEMSESA